jgi:hypothetical protein
VAKRKKAAKPIIKWIVVERVSGNSKLREVILKGANGRQMFDGNTVQKQNCERIVSGLVEQLGSSVIVVRNDE